VTDGNAKANAREEVAHGDEALAAARCLIDNGFLRDAVSRAYYAAFHWARAMLLRKGIEPKTHRGVVQLFSLHFVKDGPLSEETASLLAHLETYRELSDYTPAAAFTAEQAREEVSRAERFIDACRPLVR
jgi:uncharacterized protein